MEESKITAKGQTTLPKAVRDALEVGPGDQVRYFVRDGEVWIRKVQPIQRMYGLLKYDGPPVTLEDMKRAIIEGAIEGAALRAPEEAAAGATKE